MFLISQERISVVNCTYVGNRNMTSREEVMQLFNATYTTYLDLVEIISDDGDIGGLTKEDLLAAATGILAHSVAWEYRCVRAVSTNARRL